VGPLRFELRTSAV